MIMKVKIFILKKTKETIFFRYFNIILLFFLHENLYENRFVLYECFQDELFLDYTMFDYPYILNMSIKFLIEKKKIQFISYNEIHFLLYLHYLNLKLI
jgi:hypothetical protein